MPTPTVQSCLCASLLLFALTTTAGDLEDIAHLYAKWRTAVENADIAGYVSLLHRDVRLTPPGADPINGRENYRRFLEPVFKGASYRIEVVTPPEITVMDKVAVSEYEYVIHLALKSPDEDITEAGALTASRTQARYFDVLLRDESGNWTVWRHTWQ